MAKKKFNQQEFFTALEAAKRSREIVGLVDHDPNNTAAIKLSVNGRCTNWVTIPLSLIESYEILRSEVCGDHVHPFVRLALREPAHADEEALFDLASHLAAPFAPPRARLAEPDPFTRVGPRQMTEAFALRDASDVQPCTWQWCWDSVLQRRYWCCK